MATTGTLTKKTEPHQNWLSRNPPMTGPTASPAAPNTAHTAMVPARSSGL